jgi:hypothetical protein
MQQEDLLKQLQTQLATDKEEYVKSAKERILQHFEASLANRQLTDDERACIMSKLRASIEVDC